MARAETRAATRRGRAGSGGITVPPQGRVIARFQRAVSLVGALPLLLLGACGGPPPPAAEVSAVPAPPPPPPAPAKPLPASASVTPGFTPLPSPQQVVGPLAKGRPDPFASLELAGLGTAGGPAKPQPIALPSGFRFTGVIRSGGQSQALVEVGGEAGPLCLGARGSCPGTAPLLPAGWSVAAIDVQNGLLSLRQGKQALTLSL